MNRKLFGAFALTLCSGCAMFAPTPLSFPADSDTNATYKDYIGIPGKAAIGGIRDQIWQYFGAWRKAAQERRTAMFYGGEATFVGVVTAAVAAIRQSKEGGLIGAGLASAGTLFNSHYALAVQATNYDSGAKAMRCLHDVLTEVDDNTWNKLFDGQGGFLPDGNSEELRKISGIPAAANGAIGDIVQKLYTAQVSVQLVTPSPTEIKDAFTSYSKADQAASTKVVAIRNLPAPRGGSNAIATIPDVTLDKLVKMPEALKACVATFS